MALKHMKPMPVALTPEQRAWLKKEAERTGNSAAAIIRALIDQAMQREQQRERDQERSERR